MLNERIRALRKRSRETQQQMADKLNVSQRTVASWENNERNPSFEVLLLIADTYNVSTDYLLGRTDVIDPPIMPEIAAAHASDEVTPAMEIRFRQIIQEVIEKYGVEKDGTDGL